MYYGRDRVVEVMGWITLPIWIIQVGFLCFYSLKHVHDNPTLYSTAHVLNAYMQRENYSQLAIEQVVCFVAILGIIGFFIFILTHEMAHTPEEESQ